MVFTVRIQINPNDPDDLAKIRKLQEEIVVETGSKNDHVLSDCDMDQLLALRTELIGEDRSVAVQIRLDNCDVISDVSRGFDDANNKRTQSDF